MKRIGYDSLLLIAITSAFTGFVTAVQASYQTSGYIPTQLIGVLVGKSTMIELAPVLTALVLSGRVGASIAAEIGTMKVSEQIDALETMAIDPYDLLYMPRIIAGLIMLPVITVLANVIGIFSAFAISSFQYGIGFHSFFFNMRQYFDPWDLWGGLVKAFFFGFVITSVACFIGKDTANGAEGVGKAAT
ncbi:MAG: ABC transporter permease, partial [Candidatus Cloacimonetes bacterium]|nr:ABC transporter permease [Candidatus Cloacimonadota bacterium]